jgi:hypothetical protein
MNRARNLAIVALALSALLAGSPTQAGDGYYHHRHHGGWYRGAGFGYGGGYGYSGLPWPLTIPFAVVGAALSVPVAVLGAVAPPVYYGPPPGYYPPY